MNCDVINPRLRKRNLECTTTGRGGSRNILQSRTFPSVNKPKAVILFRNIGGKIDKNKATNIQRTGKGCLHRKLSQREATTPATSRWNVRETAWTGRVLSHRHQREDKNLSSPLLPSHRSSPNLRSNFIGIPGRAGEETSI